MPAVIIMSVWKGFGTNMLIFLAGLQGIPQELEEAAMIDGANPLAAFLAGYLAFVDANDLLCAGHLLHCLFSGL